MIAAAIEDLKSANDIQIEEADNSVADQAEKIEQVFDEVYEVLPNVTNAGGTQGVILVTVFPTMRPTTSGFFPMKANLRNVTPGRRLLFWPSPAAMKANARGASITENEEVEGPQEISLAQAFAMLSASGSEGDAFFLDENGNPVTKVTGDASKMQVVPYLEGGKTYDSAFITADATADDLEALKTLASDNTVQENGSVSTNGGGGGCELGLGLGALAALMAFTKFSKRR